MNAVILPSNLTHSWLMEKFKKEFNRDVDNPQEYIDWLENYIEREDRMRQLRSAKVSAYLNGLANQLVKNADELQRSGL